MSWDTGQTVLFPSDITHIDCNNLHCSIYKPFVQFIFFVNFILRRNVFMDDGDMGNILTIIDIPRPLYR